MTREQAEGGHLRLLYPDGGSEDGLAEAHLREAAERGEYSGEGHRIRGDGSGFWAGITLTALRDPEGVLLGFANVTRDLTARRSTSAALLAAHAAADQGRAHAEEASRAKSLFFATMSHEIRTPLNSIMAYSDLLDMEIGGPLTEKQREQLRRIRTRSTHLLGVVNDVLDFARVEAGRALVDQATGDLRPVIADALCLVDAQAEAAGVEMIDAVSGFASILAYQGDEERVRQILLNLFTNAIKFTEPGGRITVSAGTATQPPDDAALSGPAPWLYVRVEDTGIGIPAERLAAIFDPFVQADMSLTRQHGGSGLGLAISQRLARLMEGTLVVRSQVGLGSTFILWLPAAAEAERIERPRPAALGREDVQIFDEMHTVLLGGIERIVHAYRRDLRALRAGAFGPHAYRRGYRPLARDHPRPRARDDEGDILVAGEPGVGSTFRVRLPSADSDHPRLAPRGGPPSEKE